MSRLLLVDNQDSFTWNLAQYFMELGARVDVVCADRRPSTGRLVADYDGVVISPGPGRPEDAVGSIETIRACSGRLPLLGVCLGHQALTTVFGARVVPAPVLVHGKTSPIVHDGRTIFEHLASPFEATRYHSLVVDRESLPACFEISAETPDGVVMAVRHRDLPMEGVQFHPESILTAAGKPLLENFLAHVMRERTARCNRRAGVPSC